MKEGKTSYRAFFSFWQSGFRHRLETAFLVCIDPSTPPTLKAERKREGDTLRWKITVAINGRPIAEEALKNTIAVSERFDEIVAQVKARLSPR